MTPAVIESMTTLNIYDDRNGLLTVRIWREETAVQDRYDNADLKSAMDEVLVKSVKNIASYLIEMPRVSAVEVKNEDGNGVVTYVSWP